MGWSFLRRFALAIAALLTVAKYSPSDSVPLAERLQSRLARSLTFVIPAGYLAKASVSSPFAPLGARRKGNTN